MKHCLPIVCVAMAAVLGLWGGLSGDVPAAEPQPAASFTIRADWFDRGNVRVSVPGESYADKFPCIWNAGELPNQAEYDLDFPITADYTLVALYAAHDSRPVDILLDGVKIQRGFAGVTGSWQTSTAKWETQCTIRVTKGRHTIKLLCPGPCTCHICGFRLESPIPFPENWRLSRPVARQKRQRRGPAPAKVHLVPAIQGLGSGPITVEQVELGRAAGDSSIGSPVNNELISDDDGTDAHVAGRVGTVTIRTSAGQVKKVSLSLSVARLEKMLERTIALIDDFRTLDGTAAGFLQAARNRALQMASEVNRFSDGPRNDAGWERLARLSVETAQLEHRVMLSNPLLNFDRLLLVKRRLAAGDHGYSGDPYGLPYNWQSNSSIRGDVWDNEIAVLEPVGGEGKLRTLYRPQGNRFVGDVDLDFSGRKMLFSSLGAAGRWQVMEISADGRNLRQLTPEVQDVNNYDACYLPDGGIIFSSTASMAAVPCVNGSSLVANSYRMDADGENIRQLCFDQEHDWCPTVMPDGRVLYLRWEYTDTPHSHARLLFQMNPDGTGQMEFYGGNSYWPNSLFYARPIPGHATKFVGIVSGHHGVRRMGELVLFDSARGHHEAAGAVQRIPGRGRAVQPLIADQLVDASWPKFLHPYPLSEKYILVAAQPTAQSEWGIYLVDVFDNMLLLAEIPGYALFEPIPFRSTPRPPVIPDQVAPNRKDALVYLADVYAGDGLVGIPRGTVKALRIISYHFLYPGMGGPQGVVGMEGPWDIKRILGTVPVEEDGSAMFHIPANTPVAVQPLDCEGKALQLMRSWFTGMPGEVVSCVGCHDQRNTGPPVKPTLAEYRRPREITPWYGPARGFSFEREVQPVLDEYCVGCHDGRIGHGGRPIADLRGLERITDYTSAYHFGGKDAGHFSTSYVALHRFVRRPGLESDYHLLTPMEFHADTTQLVQLLARGHFHVQLDAEAWDRLITWIDLNAPFHGTWTEIAGHDRVEHYARRRRELRRLYNGLEDDPEAIPAVATAPPEPILTKPILPEPILPKSLSGTSAGLVNVPGWPFDEQEAQRRQHAMGEIQRTIELPDGGPMDLVLIPPGEFVMGDAGGDPNGRPLHRVAIDQAFWIGRLEVTNRQYAAFDPQHDSRVESRFGMQFGVRGFYVNGPDQPVVRVPWQRAMAFCEWLGRETSLEVTLPSEAQWEYACRAGTASAFYFGDEGTDFSPFANLADATLSEFVCHPYKKDRQPLANRSKYDDWIPKDDRFNDGGFLSDSVGNYRPNAWGLFDMHGNVWEWTRSAPWVYPYRDDDGRNDPTLGEQNRVVRGGSWRDRPKRARSSFRLAYRPYQPVYNVGFRVVCRK